MKTIEVAAGIIQNGKTGKVLATQRGYGEFRGKWEFPGGKLEPGEAREAALVRELREELAVNVRIESFLSTVEYDYPNFHLTMHAFLCSVESGEITLLEHQSAKWLSPGELREIEWLPADKELVNRLNESSW